MNKTLKQKREEAESQEIRRYLLKNYTDLEITNTLNISMSKLLQYKKILGEEASEKYSPDSCPHTLGTSMVEFKERMLFVIRTCNHSLSNPKTSAKIKLKNEKLKRKTFVEMIKHLSKAETELEFDETDRQLEEEYRKIVGKAKDLKSKLNIMKESEIDQAIIEWLSLPRYMLRLS